MSNKNKQVVSEIEDYLNESSLEFTNSVSELIDDEELVSEIGSLFTVASSDTALNTFKVLETQDLISSELVKELEESLFGDLDD